MHKKTEILMTGAIAGILVVGVLAVGMPAPVLARGHIVGAGGHGVNGANGVHIVGQGGHG